MTAFTDWQRFAVPQKHESTGCIPWTYEIMLRAADTEGIDWTTFQEDFDLNRQAGSSVANFQNVADAVRNRYPHAVIEAKGFATGAEKLAFVESRIQRQEPTVVSLAWEGVTNGAQRGWHMMPVVDADEHNLLLLCSVSTAGQATVIRLPRAEFVRIHDQYDGGKDVAYVRQPPT